jgi:alpha-beta hydrolase superfamily lysophospholipase
VCFQKAQVVIRANFFKLDPQHAAHPDLNGPSDYWGRSEYVEVDHPTPYVALLMHGIYADGRQLAPEAAFMAKLGIPVLNLVLAGHGTTNDLAGRVQVQDWIEDAERAFRLATALGDRVILIGHSTGAILSVYLSLKFNQKVVTTFLIEPAVRVSPLVQAAACLSQSKIANLADYPFLVRIYGQDPDALQNRVISPAAGCQVHLLRKAVTDLFPPNDLSLSDLEVSEALGEKMTTPVLMFNNEHDFVVDSKHNEAFIKGAALNGMAESVSFNRDFKMPHGNITFHHSDMILSKMEEFLETYLPEIQSLKKPVSIELSSPWNRDLSILDDIEIDRY